MAKRKLLGGILGSTISTELIFSEVSCEKANFQKSVFSLHGSTILKDSSASTLNKNGSKRVLQRHLFASWWSRRFWYVLDTLSVPCWSPQSSQVGTKMDQKIS